MSEIETLTCEIQFDANENISADSIRQIESTMDTMRQKLNQLKSMSTEPEKEI